MEYNEVQLKDFKKAELELSGEEEVFISQKDKTRNTLLSKIKDFIIGTNTMGTTATDVTGAVKELNDKIGSVEKEGSVIAHLNDKANLSDIKIFTSLSDIGLSLDDMTTDFGSNILKIIKAMGRNRKIVLYPYQDETNTNLYNSVKTWCGYNTDAYTLIVNSSFNGSENLPNKIEVLPNYNTGNNKMFIGFYDNQLGTAQEVAITKKQQLTLLNGWLPYDVQPYTACCGNLLCVNMRIKSGTYTAGTWIAETGKIPLGGGSNFFQATDVSGSEIGSVALTNTGRIEIVGAFSHNADVSINFTATIN
ncbi:hypothetical protein [Clostridium butyricum]|uniref:hypothetical protein n=1 Tax=Clostridium butyricum TaxID=1492 RepID=UPI0012B73C04|nr:hypothetical protein [Clostridium butyricum]